MQGYQLQSEAVSQRWGDVSAGSTYIGDLAVNGAQIIGGTNPLIPTSNPAPNTWIQLVQSGQVGVCIGLNIQSGVPGGVNVSAVVVREYTAPHAGNSAAVLPCLYGRDLLDIANTQAAASV